MPFWVYVLRSESTRKLYTGQTSNLEKRMERHNDQEHGERRYTRKQKGPWRLIYSKRLPTRSDAMELEKRIKKRGIARYLEDVQLAESR
ncbi:MAG: GIY-YIG nuclease family protein [Deltaproteobacteria bacterium]|nr:GIY-YIG nuclease family protein [Deltaproteobacteria bacterium]MBW1909549.1 GIY-YIG nuclease family protein [Deltaproteobacteria bacterium]MBW2032640.1 GIY-YIG nuclease family protein [Deltaproteobacteria bacterium]MBW2114039.1 GIY-YIG nuclease family protein [Deltaproteobacteria bacterium]MBW2169639.1 GIY-YIG nuclease family protein [Deltaproteobacteria bacterium]